MAKLRPDGRMGCQLQWGRADEGAEITSESVNDMFARSLQWGRADEGAEMCRPVAGWRHRHSFNGAAPMKARK